MCKFLQNVKTSLLREYLKKTVDFCRFLLILSQNCRNFHIAKRKSLFGLHLFFEKCKQAFVSFLDIHFSCKFTILPIFVKSENNYTNLSGSKVCPTVVFSYIHTLYKHEFVSVQRCCSDRIVVLMILATVSTKILHWAIKSLDQLMVTQYLLCSQHLKR